jgi:hypothetical protein
MYVRPNFITKKALVAAVDRGDVVTVFQPGGLFPGVEDDGTAYLEGPHYPAMHSWYATCMTKHAVIVKGSIS